MGQVRHGSATTMHAARAAMQRSQASIAPLSTGSGAAGYPAALNATYNVKDQAGAATG